MGRAKIRSRSQENLEDVLTATVVKGRLVGTFIIDFWCVHSDRCPSDVMPCTSNNGNNDDVSLQQYFYAMVLHVLVLTYSPDVPSPPRQEQVHVFVPQGPYHAPRQEVEEAEPLWTAKQTTTETSDERVEKEYPCANLGARWCELTHPTERVQRSFAEPHNPHSSIPLQQYSEVYCGETVPKPSPFSLSHNRVDQKSSLQHACNDAAAKICRRMRDCLARNTTCTDYGRTIYYCCR